MPYTTIFFDLDDTLYTSGTGLWDAIRDRISLYMLERVGIPKDQVPALRRAYYTNYGTTLRGLQKHHQIDTDDYLNYVHDLPLDQYIQPTPGLKELLLSLPQQRWIFTNADAGHARRVTATLGLSGCFDGIIDIRALEFTCKPETEAYQRALALTGGPSPEQCVFLDDAPVNLAPARQLGFTTVLVGGNSHPDPAAVYTLPNLLALPQVMPFLWRSDV